MSLPFMTATGAAAFFPVKDHMNDLALLIEPKSIAKGVPHTYNGVTKNRDEVVADVTVFATSESLETGEPSSIQKGVKFAHGMLTSELERAIGGAFLGIIRKVPTKSGSGYAFRVPGEDVQAKVAAYHEKREAAIAAALADVPDFD